MERQVKGIWIPIEIWEASGLCWNEKILLMEIDSFTSKGKDCYISNEFISGLLDVSERVASKYISNLIDNGFVRVVKFDGRKRYVESTLNGFQTEWKKSSMQGGTKVPGRVEEKFHIYIESTDKSSINIEDKRERKGFTPPAIDEVRQYCQERNNGIDPEEFVAFYTSKGWMVGKSKMKDWKSAVITWEKSRQKDSRRTPRPQPQRKESVFEHNMRVMDKMFGTNYHEQMYGEKEVADEQ